MHRPNRDPDEIEVGGFYYDCSYHPVLCTENDGEGVCGISLVDGSFPRSCSIKHCAPTPLTLEEALWVRFNGPFDEDKEHLQAVIDDGGWCQDYEKWWEEKIGSS